MKKLFFYIGILLVLFSPTTSFAKNAIVGCDIKNSDIFLIQQSHYSHHENIYVNTIELSEEEEEDSNDTNKRKNTHIHCLSIAPVTAKIIQSIFYKRSLSKDDFFQLPSSHFISLRVLRL